jgi:probable HAF family extracellular repeat protein
MIKLILSCACIFLVALTLVGDVPRRESDAPGYEIQDLGTLGGASSNVNGMNASGHVVGSSLTSAAGSFHAYLYYDRAMHDLGTLGGFESSANAVNDSDEVVGRAEVGDGSVHGFLYIRSSNSLLDLQPLFDSAGFGGTKSSAVGINNVGQIVGGATTASEDMHAFVWDRQNGSVRDLHSAVSFGGSNSKAFSISDSGRIVGASEDASGNQIGFVYDLGSGTLVRLGTFGGATSETVAINASGQVTGAADLDSTDAYHAYRCDGQSALTTANDVGTLGGSQSTGFGINDAGVVVGTASDANGQAFAVIYDSTNGLRNLETLLASNPGWVLVAGAAINNSGQVAGAGYINGYKHAFLMTPPSTPSDNTAPTLLLPSNITAEATEPSGAVVTYTASATDDTDPHPSVVCSPSSGSTFALGTTTVQCTATDASGNSAGGSFNVTIVDTTPPALVIPANITADATSPQGAVVSFTASATDIADPHPSVSCTPTAGISFAIGVVVVQCFATDASHNSSQASFTVTVNGASAQTANLISLVASFNIAQGISNSLDAKLQNVLDSLSAANAGNRSNACNQLTAFINNVVAQSGKQLTVAQATQLIARANQIRSVQGCP